MSFLCNYKYEISSKMALNVIKNSLAVLEMHFGFLVLSVGVIFEKKWHL